MRQALTGISMLVLVGCAQSPAAPDAEDPARYVQPTPAPLTTGTVIEEAVGEQKATIVLPEGFKKGATERYPTLVFFHSYQQDSRQLTKLTRFVRLAPPGWVLASADLGGDAHWGNQKAISLHLQLMAHLRDRYQADPTRVCYVGFSMGGGTALLAAMAAKGTPDEPAAVATSQGWTNLMQMREVQNGMYASSIDAAYGGAVSVADRARGDLVARAAELAGIPLFLEHGEADTYVPPSHARNLHDRLTELGLAHVFRIHAGLGHTENTIHEGLIYDFFQGKQRVR